MEHCRLTRVGSKTVSLEDGMRHDSITVKGALIWAVEAAFVDFFTTFEIPHQLRTKRTRRSVHVAMKTVPVGGSILRFARCAPGFNALRKCCPTHFCARCRTDRSSPVASSLCFQIVVRTQQNFPRACASRT